MKYVIFIPLLLLTACNPSAMLSCQQNVLAEGASTVCTMTLPFPVTTEVTVELSYVGLEGPTVVTIPAGQSAITFVVMAQ